MSAQDRPLSEKTTKKGRVKAAKVLELGLIYFFFRPKVDSTEVNSFDDVQRFYILLSPSKSLKVPAEGNEETNKRLILMPQKKLPAVTGKRHERVWGFVDMVTKNTKEIDETLGRSTYETKTKGTREVQPVRVVGEGVYELISHGDNDQVSLAYVLEVPQEPGEVQAAFNVEKEASYIVQVKNPKASSSGSGRFGLPSHQRPTYSEDVQAKFKGVRVEERKWIPLVPATLDHVHTELLFIGEADNLLDEFGEVGAALEEEEREDEQRAQKELGSKLDDKPYQELHMSKKEFPEAEHQWK